MNSIEKAIEKYHPIPISVIAVADDIIFEENEQQEWDEQQYSASPGLSSLERLFEKPIELNELNIANTLHAQEQSNSSPTQNQTKTPTKATKVSTQASAQASIIEHAELKSPTKKTITHSDKVTKILPKSSKSSIEKTDNQKQAVQKERGENLESSAKNPDQIKPDNELVENNASINQATKAEFEPEVPEDTSRQAQQHQEEIAIADETKTPQDTDSQEEHHRRNSRQIELDMEMLESKGFLLPHGEFSVLHDEYRKIKRPLIDNIRRKNSTDSKYINLIQVTSAWQGEGKTFSSINLSIAIAMEMDINVLLVDADVIRASVTRTLVNKVEKGLTDYLAGDVKDLSDVLLSTNIPKLKILPAGTTNYLSPELLNSEYMAQLMSEFSERYDNRVVIIDSAPILMSNEAIILASKVGQIVFVVEQNKTEQSKVKKALELIDRDEIVGLLVNKARSRKKGDKSEYL